MGGTQGPVNCSVSKVSRSRSRDNETNWTVTVVGTYLLYRSRRSGEGWSGWKGGYRIEVQRTEVPTLLVEESSGLTSSSLWFLVHKSGLVTEGKSKDLQGFFTGGRRLWVYTQKSLIRPVYYFFLSLSDYFSTSVLVWDRRTDLRVGLTDTIGVRSTGYRDSEPKEWMSLSLPPIVLLLRGRVRL